MKHFDFSRSHDIQAKNHDGVKASTNANGFGVDGEDMAVFDGDYDMGEPIDDDGDATWTDDSGGNAPWFDDYVARQRS